MSAERREAAIEVAYDDEVRRAGGEYPRLRHEGIRLVRVGYDAALREEREGSSDDDQCVCGHVRQAVRITLAASVPARCSRTCTTRAVPAIAVHVAAREAARPELA
jgi:hypothetical protein